MEDVFERLKPLKTSDAAIEQAVKEFNKTINKAYRKIERTGYPLNTFEIAEKAIKKFWEQDSFNLK